MTNYVTVIAGVRPVHLMNIEQRYTDSRNQAYLLGPQVRLSTANGQHPPSAVIITNQPESWHSFYHPTEGRRLSWPEGNIEALPVVGPRTWRLLSRYSSATQRNVVVSCHARPGRWRSCCTISLWLHSLGWRCVLIGCRVQPRLQASEVAIVLDRPGPFLPSNLPVITTFSSFDFPTTWPKISACLVLVVINRCLSVAARLRTLLLVSWSVQGMRIYQDWQYI